jgi:multicomponent K+:H+ antiporter subunit E
VKILPHPVLSIALALAWLLLAGLSAGQLLLAVAVALLVPQLTRHFFDEPFGHARGWRSAAHAARFTALVVADIVVANVAVARLVLGPMRRLRPAFVEVPLELEQPLAISLLGSIVTMTPGTVSAELSMDRRRLLVHVLDTGNPAALVETIKARYERPLMEIFA